MRMAVNKEMASEIEIPEGNYPLNRSAAADIPSFELSYVSRAKQG